MAEPLMIRNHEVALYLIAMLARDKESVTKHYRIKEILKVLPIGYERLAHVAIYSSPITLSGLKRKIVSEIGHELDTGIAYDFPNKVSCDDSSIIDTVEELRNLKSKSRMRDETIKALEDLESGEWIREQQAIDRLTSVTTEYASGSPMDEEEFDNVDTDLDDGGRIEMMFEDSNRSGHPRSGTIFDKWMHIGPGEMGVILSAPGVGKTTSMIDLGSGYAENNEGVVIHFSEEMSFQSVFQKYMSRICGREVVEINKDTVAQFKSVMSKKPGSIVVESHASGSSTIPFLKKRVIDILSGRNLVAIIVDYAGLLKNDDTTSRYDSLSKVIVNLRAMANYFKCPLWTGSQPQRNPTKESVGSVQLRGFNPPVLGMADVAECWAIPHVADYLVSLNQTDEEKGKDVPEVRVHRAKARIPIAGNKANKTLTIKAQIDYPICSIT